MGGEWESQRCAVGLTILIGAMRGPYEQGWIGWTGGWDARKKNLAEATSGNGPCAIAELETTDEHEEKK